MARHACTFPVLLSFNIAHLWTLKPDGCTVINNVFPLWAIKYSVSGSLGWSGELKGASTVVVEGRGIFGTQNFPSSLKQPWVVTHHRMMVLFCLPVMISDGKNSVTFSGNITCALCGFWEEILIRGQKIYLFFLTPQQTDLKGRHYFILFYFVYIRQTRPPF